MQPPKSPSEVKSLLDMAQYVSRFIPNYSTITAPLRALTHQNSVWKWEIEEETAFRKLQNELTSDRVMAYFDASPTGLGAILMQDGKVISYGNRTLADVESRYTQTEREMLAVVWATEHYHLYLYGASLVPRRYVLFYGLRGLCVGRVDQFDRFRCEAPGRIRFDFWSGLRFLERT
jgi:hypothetical protein